MKRVPDVCDSYIIDTCRIGGAYIAGAMTFKGRKKLEPLQWQQEEFKTKEEANGFVRAYFSNLGIPEVSSEDELAARHPRW